MSVPTDSETRWSAYGVHVLTASGIIPAAFAMREIASPDCDPRVVFGLLLLTTFIDAIDGPLARRYHVKTRAAAIDGRTIDDLLDYLTFAFIPLMLVWQMQWLPEGTGWTVTIAMGASLFGFAHRDAKDEDAGFFRGFPSYWNVFAFYAGILFSTVGPWAIVILLWTLTLLTILPVRFIYPNLAPGSWRKPLLGGALVWSLLMLAMLFDYPSPSDWLTNLSLVYPVIYTLASFWMQLKRPRPRR
ncbi:CDP-alcohol phosphatidyltransferase family protein [Neorhodopirellula pilleata]|uniref:Phosphatidylcholine synthase n=1 Tax=Neorhodopirellula pilleata TaxID=2714738 RepID=A0A5C6A6L2_9BACT|nr:CDP-alcohol phosphatidyltransferase family protein [Neorhodopirellula pilleata]TWT95086.1 Phosphatidylcholine synthase [Neorhodopirellula pilleata]